MTQDQRHHAIGWGPRLALALGVAALLAIGLLQLLPATCPSVAIVTDFSCDTALGHVRQIARVPHPADSQANAEVRQYLIEQMEALHLSPREQVVRYASIGRLHVLHNLTGRLPGTSPGPAVMLACHYDSVVYGPGAGDDAAAVGALLETMQAIEAGPRLRNDIVLLITDGEELNLLGARGMAHDHVLPPNIGLVLNFDARGSSGPSMLYETSSGNEQLVRAYAKAAPYPVGTSLGYDVYRKMPNNTDFTIFRGEGLKGLNFAFIGGYVNYHTPNDTVENLSRDTIYHIGTNALSMARYFGNADLTALRDTPARDAIFFNPVPGFMVVYGSRRIWPITMLLLLLTGTLLFRGWRQKRFTAIGIFEGIGRLILGCGLSMGFVWAAWRLVDLALVRGWLSSQPGFILRPSPSPVTVIGLVVVFSIITVFISLSCALLWRRASLDDLSATGALVWLILCVATSVGLPGGSYLAAWPALFALIGLSRPRRNAWITVALVLIASMPTLLLLPPSIGLFLTALTLRSAFLVAPLIVLSVWILITSGCVPILFNHEGRTISNSRVTST